MPRRQSYIHAAALRHSPPLSLPWDKQGRRLQLTRELEKQMRFQDLVRDCDPQGENLNVNFLCSHERKQSD